MVDEPPHVPAMIESRTLTNIGFGSQLLTSLAVTKVVSAFTAQEIVTSAGKLSKVGFISSVTVIVWTAEVSLPQPSIAV